MDTPAGNDENIQPTEELVGEIRVEGDLVDGVFLARVLMPDCEPQTLNANMARQWAHEVTQAVNAAEHDAAILRQLLSLKIEQGAVGDLLRDLRSDRYEYINVTAAPGLRLVPIVNEHLMPVVGVFLHEGQVAQLSAAEGRQHASQMMSLAATLPLDQAYFQLLQNKVGLESWRAAVIVAELSDHRQKLLEQQTP